MQSADTLGVLFRDIHRGWLSAALLIWILLYFLSPLFSVQILRGLGEDVSYRLLTSIFISRLPAKYLPGGIWQTVARAWDLRARGITTPRITQVLAYELLMPVLAAFAVGAALLALFHRGPVPVSLLVGTALGAALAFVLLPWLLRRLPATRDAVPHRTRYGSAVVLILLYWVLAGAAFGCFITSLGVAELDAGVPALAGAYSMSWAVGYLAFFAPQGLGVLEFTANRLIDLPLDTATGISVVFSFRLLVVVLDLLAWLAYSLLSLARQR